MGDDKAPVTDDDSEGCEWLFRDRAVGRYQRLTRWAVFGCVIFVAWHDLQVRDPRKIPDAIRPPG